jgi:hypothetical protein
VFGVEIAASLLLVGALPRAEADRPDEVRGPQIHVVYAVPSDRADRGLDTSGAIQGSVSLFQRWLAEQTGGPNLRVDTYMGMLDVTFARLDKTDAEISARGAFVREEIEAFLDRRGLTTAGKIYAVYYDGTSTYSCGGASWPPYVAGRLAAMYLNGLPQGPVPCSSNPLRSDTPWYWEFAMLHDLLHTLGIVPTCAPHHWRAAHVSDSPNDLMWAGDEPWQLPPQLDIGRDDYYGHGRADCADLAGSEYLTSTPVFEVASYRVGVARAGRAFSVRLAVEVDGAAPATGSTVCTARLGTRTLRSRAGFTAGQGACTWTLPRTAVGKRLTGSIAVTTAEGSATRRFSLRVRR